VPDTGQGISSHSGLALIGAVLDRTNIRERLDKVMLPGHPFPEISHGEVATAMIGLICLGKPDFDAIEPFRGDPFFAQSLGLDLVPSSPTLRLRAVPGVASATSFWRNLLGW
jgi:hypothetical protein